MPESSDNPPPGEKPAGDKPAGAPAVPPSPRPARGTPEPVAGTHISLEDLLALARTLSETGGDLAEPERGPISRQQRKFSRGEIRGARAEGGGATLEKPVPEEPLGKTVPPDFPVPLTLPPAGGDPSLPFHGSSPLPLPASLPSMTARSRRGRMPGRAGSWLWPAMVILVLVAFVGAVWLVAKIARPDAVKIAPAPARATPDASSLPMSLKAGELDLIDKIAEAQKAGDAPKALALCVLLRSQSPNVYGLSYQEATLAATVGDFQAALVALNRSLRAGEEMSACYMLRAAILAKDSKPEAMLRDYEAASSAAPMDPKPFFFWGEMLRRSGRPQAALVRLHQASLRAKDRDSDEFYQFKTRLTLIEMDRGVELANDLKTRLAPPSPAPDWLLTAAALELRKGDVNAASGFLERASALLTPEQFSSRLRDYYFFGFSAEPALAKFYGPILKPAAKAEAPPAGAVPPAALALPPPGPAPETPKGPQPQG